MGTDRTDTQRIEALETWQEEFTKTQKAAIERVAANKPIQQGGRDQLAIHPNALEGSRAQTAVHGALRRSETGRKHRPRAPASLR
jgi:hypothetical protein